MTTRKAAAGYTTLAAVAAGGAAITSSRYMRDIAVARSRVSIGSRVIATDCGPIEFAEFGSGFPVLAIHGAGGGFDQAADFCEPFLKHGLGVIAPSRFGYLRTPLPKDACPIAQANAHAALLDAIGVDKVIVAGISAGAPSAAQFALRYPDRCVALILYVPLLYSPVERGSGRGSRLLLRAMDALFRSDFVFWAATQYAEKALVKSILGTPVSVFENANDEEKASVRAILQHILPISARRKGLLNDSAIAMSIESYPLDELTVPTLLISAADDLYGTSSSALDAAVRIPDSRMIRFSTGGHLLVGHAQEIETQVAGFVSDVLLAKAS